MRAKFYFTMPFFSRLKFLFWGWLYLEVHCKAKTIVGVSGIPVRSGKENDIKNSSNI